MSYDLLIYGKTELSYPEIAAIIGSLDGVEAGGDFSATEIPPVYDKGTGALSFTIEGPYRIEAEDIPEGWDEVAGATVLYSVLVSVGMQVGLAEATRFAERLAERAHGHVIDPQTYEPRTVAVNDAPSSDDLYIHASWYRLRDGASDLADRYLQSARELFRSAVPARFGTSEPLQSRLGQDNDEDFTTLYAEDCSISDLVFKAKDIEDGRITGWTDDYRDRFQAVHLTYKLASFDRASRKQPFEEFFIELARRSGSFFAFAELNRSRYTDASSPAFNGAWGGLPRQPQWMTWYGPEYLEFVRPFLTSGVITDFAEGSAHLWTERPSTVAEIRPLLKRVPWVPPRLLATTSPDDEWQVIAPARMTPEVLRGPVPGSPEDLRIEANIARNRAKVRRR